MGKLVLIVDDEPGILTTLGNVLSDEGYETVATQSGEEAISLYESKRPDVVFLDIWLPDRDGLETLEALREMDPSAAVIMMSGHGTPSTAVKAIKMGAFDYVEKPVSYNRVVESVSEALRYRQSLDAAAGGPERRQAVKPKPERERRFSPAPELPLLETVEIPQRTIRRSTVIYGLGLHSGSSTGMVIQPLPVDSGVHFMTLPTNTHIPSHVGEVEETGYATTLAREGATIRTVEHLLSALHAYGITNLLIKVHGEIPVLDGSALEFCRTIEGTGIVDQDKPRRELVIDRHYSVSTEDEKVLSLEPYDGFAISYLLRYPAPIGEQQYEFELTSPERYKQEIAPARTFGFMRDLKMMNELGRHKILDVIGDLYLLGYPIRGKVCARLTGHRHNIAILREIIRSSS
jgi:UDP-3-O-[3-hydroxymyristoyl] N-acetylglucosamine deacetylase